MATVRDTPERTGLPAHEHLHSGASELALHAAVGALRERGERVTLARRAVLEVLARTHEHLSADDVAVLLEATHPSVHRASVYRTLDLLTRLGIVSHIHANGGATVYHLAAAPAGHEHLHAHCRLCGSVVVVPADALAATTARVASATGFRVEPAQSALVGVCAECAAP
jgi:Fur family ferric uptake transcriptional regulator